MLLYGAETWVVSHAHMRELNAFHHRCARYITHRHITQNDDGTWAYPDSASTLEIAGLYYPMETYIQRRRNIEHGLALFKTTRHLQEEEEVS